MTLLKRHDEAFIDALRADLPSDNDERRVRARLLAAGVMAGASLAVPGTVAAAGAASAPLGFVSKLAGLSWGAKAGLAGVVAVIAAGAPAAMELASNRLGTAPTGAADTIKPMTQRAAHQPATGPTGSMPVSSGLSRQVELPNRLEHALANQNALGSGAGATVIKRKPRKPQSSAEPAPSERASRQPTSEASASESIRAFPNVEVSALYEPTMAPRGSSPVQAPDGIESSEPHSMLAEESLLMQRAMLALRARDRAAALFWLGEHTRRFPQGKLERERERALERAHRLAPSERE